MIIWGKVFGALIGYFFYGPVGVILGLCFGQVFDNGLKTILRAPTHAEEVRSVFFRTVFQTIGYLAKSDGVVSEREIAAARAVMLNYFSLNTKQQKIAIEYFTQGKQPNFNIQQVLQRFKQVCSKYTDLRRYFLEMMVKVSMADGVLRDAQRGRLIFICSRIGISLTELENQLRVYGYSAFSQQRSQQQQAKNSSNQQNTNSRQEKSNSRPYADDKLTIAYKTLGVKATDSEKVIKSAYRKLISKYHPDKLVAKGLPPEMMEIAKQKTQQITVAYDVIIRSRK